LIVDDHAIVREGLSKLVEAEPDLEVCFEAGTAREALEAVESRDFELAIVDISLEDMNGLELTRKLKAVRPNTTVMILSMYDGRFYIRRALEAGASGYVVKYEAAEKIIKAIRQVLRGGTPVSDGRAAENGD
jgi:DNA-binding NarL/FixJ family response regulator